MASKLVTIAVYIYIGHLRAANWPWCTRRLGAFAGTGVLHSVVYEQSHIRKGLRGISKHTTIPRPGKLSSRCRHHHRHRRHVSAATHMATSCPKLLPYRYSMCKWR